VIPHWEWLLLWGTLVGLDLVSVGQVMIARPLVAGTIAALVVGDPVTGGMVAVILELFALDVLPVGATQYPDYGLGAVAAVAAVAGAPGVLGVGVAICVGLAMAYSGDVATRFVRHRNTADARRVRAALDAGDPRAIGAFHLRCLGRDALRGFAVTAAGLAVASAVQRWPFFSVEGAVLVTVVVIGAALGAGITGILRLSGQGGVFRWLLAGIVAGAVLVVAL
jgi:PTS system mannose-specific IIC component